MYYGHKLHLLVYHEFDFACQVLINQLSSTKWCCRHLGGSVYGFKLW